MSGPAGSPTTAPTTVVFVGLGIMGLPMAGHLVRAGHSVLGINRSPAAVERFVANGGRTASSLAEDGIYANARPGTVHLDMSTIRPDVAAQLAETGAAHGVRVLDAPVSGGQVGAREAALSIMVGGDAATFAEVRPLLEVMGRTIIHVGPAGSGQTVKAANQLIVAGNLQLVAEAIVFLEAHGVDTTSALQVLAGGLAGSTVLDRKGAAMLERSFAPGFRIDLHHKDMGIIVDAARTQGVAIPLGAVTAQLIGALRAQGDGGLDHSALLRGVERLSGKAEIPRPDVDRPG